MRSVAAILAFLVCVVCVPVFSLASSYKVSGIEVDKTHKSGASVASKLALQEGQKKAFAILMKRVASSRHGELVESLDSDEIVAMVQSLEVADEKITAKRYRAKIDVTFNRNFIEQFLSESGIRIQSGSKAGRSVRSVTVVPLLLENGMVLSADQSHKWGKLWKQSLKARGIKDVKVAVPDAVASFVDANTYKTFDGLKDAYIAQLRGQAAGGRMAFVVGDYKFVADRIMLGVDFYPSVTQDVDSQDMVFEGAIGENLDVVLVSASNAINSKLRVRTVPNKDQFKKGQAFEIVIPVNSVNEWIETKRKIEATGMLSRFNMVEMTMKEVVAEAVLSTSLDEFSDALESSNLYIEQVGGQLMLSRGSDSFWGMY